MGALNDHSDRAQPSSTAQISPSQKQGGRQWGVCTRFETETFGLSELCKHSSLFQAALHCDCCQTIPETSRHKAKAAPGDTMGASAKTGSARIDESARTRLVPQTFRLATEEGLERPAATSSEKVASLALRAWMLETWDRRQAAVRSCQAHRSSSKSQQRITGIKAMAARYMTPIEMVNSHVPKRLFTRISAQAAAVITRLGTISLAFRPGALTRSAASAPGMASRSSVLASAKPRHKPAVMVDIEVRMHSE